MQNSSPEYNPFRIYTSKDVEEDPFILEPSEDEQMEAHEELEQEHE